MNVSTNVAPTDGAPTTSSTGNKSKKEFSTDSNTNAIYPIEIVYNINMKDLEDRECCLIDGRNLGMGECKVCKKRKENQKNLPNK